jgi:hypothetical protein
MPIQRDIAGTPTDITTLKRRLNGAWVDMLFLNRAFRRDTGAWVELLPAALEGDFALSVSSSSASVVYNCNDPESPPYTCPTLADLDTATVTATAVGGLGAGPTYEWTYVSGDTGFSCNSPTAATTSWSVIVPQNANKNAVWKVTATRGADTEEQQVTLSARYIRTGGIEA